MLHALCFIIFAIILSFFPLLSNKKGPRIARRVSLPNSLPLPEQGGELKGRVDKNSFGLVKCEEGLD